MPKRSQSVQGVPIGAPSIDPHGGSVWFPPGIADHVKAVVPFGDGEQGIIAAVGNWANYEVWADVPNTWLGTEMILRLHNSQAVDELDRRTFAELEHFTTEPENSGAGVLARTGVPDTDRIRGLLFSNYGRPGYGSLDVVAVRRRVVTGGEQISQRDGRFYIRVWGTEGTSMGDRVGRPIVDRWATRRQFVTYTSLAVPVSATTDAIGGFADGTFSVASGAAARAVHITDVSLTSAAVVGVNVAVTLQLEEPVSGSTLAMANWLVPGGGAVVANFALPITGRRGWNWRIIRGAGVGDVAATVGGFVA